MPSIDQIFEHALSLQQQGQPALAIDIARSGLAIAPEHAGLWQCVAECASDRQDYTLAEQGWRQLLALQPDSALGHHHLAGLLVQQQRHAEAEACYRRVIALAPGDAAPLTNLGLLLASQRRDEEAEQLQQAALALYPHSAQIHGNLAELLARRGSYAAAEAHYREAIRLAPQTAANHANLGVLLHDLGRQQQAEACFRAALRLRADHPQARMNLGQLLLAQGRFDEGWPHHEARYDTPAMQAWLRQRAAAPCQPWRGEPLAGKRLLVLPEQGYGDDIQFCRYLPWLKAQAPAWLTLVCRTPLKPLLATLQGPDALFTRDEALSVIDDYDYWVYPLSVPLYHHTRLDSIPGTQPYLGATEERRAQWQTRLPAGGLRVGLAWQGNPAHANDRERSLPDLMPLTPLWTVPGVQFVSLQMPREPAPPLAMPEFALTDLGSSVADFADLAAIISQLDLVICVDTAIAHLAGALGVPGWVLLPAYKTDWRWLHGRSDSPWYPSLRLFRQPQRGDWDTPIAEVVQALAALAARRAAAG
ncbi:tetratricopeptide repeat protein [Vogesella sp. LIG4]|uniref:tetratricopeptide repeat protein n=1 Tax=Vogesella sp. LIG4 TaxID=1192162 RepID=UPI00082000B5|nr:tetratricopeptide repeat protein [Vogesella sp. LIG4]SCK19154.1 Tfp pilus assembly protein PilF [Vogesella sp. LIG4]